MQFSQSLTVISAGQRQERVEYEVDMTSVSSTAALRSSQSLDLQLSEARTNTSLNSGSGTSLLLERWWYYKSNWGQEQNYSIADSDSLRHEMRQLFLCLLNASLSAAQQKVSFVRIIHTCSIAETLQHEHGLKKANVENNLVFKILYIETLPTVPSMLLRNYACIMDRNHALWASYQCKASGICADTEAKSWLPHLLETPEEGEKSNSR